MRYVNEVSDSTMILYLNVFGEILKSTNMSTSLIQIKDVFWHQKLQIMLYTLKNSGLYRSEKKPTVIILKF